MRDPHAARAAQIAQDAEVDPIAVARLTAGRPPARTTPAERQEATAILTSQGLSGRLIADRLHVTERTVFRLRARQQRKASA